jgi:uncharacterized protein
VAARGRIADGPVGSRSILGAHSHEIEPKKGTSVAKNVLGGDLEPCSVDPLTGFYRDGCCNTGAEDLGVHTVCARVTQEFLEFSKARGNDLSTPRPGFLGLQPGDRWCLCASRWLEALEEGMAPDVVLEATHAASLEWVSLEDLRRHAAERGA